MKDQFFLDTNFVLSLFDDKDTFHPRAKAIFEKWDEVSAEIFLSDVVLNEALTVLARKCEQRPYFGPFTPVCERFIQTVQEIPVLCLYEHFNPFFQSTVRLMKEHQGTLNFHDCLIAVFLKTVPKVHLVTFDEDFHKIPWLKILG